MVDARTEGRSTLAVRSTLSSIVACWHDDVAGEFVDQPDQSASPYGCPLQLGEPPDEPVSEGRIPGIIEAGPAEGYAASLVFSEPQDNSDPARQALQLGQAVAMENVGELVAISQPDGGGQ
jgi:hypothetical protein